MDQLISAIERTDPLSAGSSLSSVLLTLLLAFVLGQAIGWVYAWCHSGLSYSRSFTQSLVMMTLVVSLVMLVIGNSIVTAFGLLGALALIRFRNVLKDTRDTVFVFIALVVGMAVGSQRFGVAILGTIALILVVWYLNLTSFGSMGSYDGYLTCRLARGGTPGEELSQLLYRFCGAVKPVSTRQTGEQDGAELVYQVGLRDRNRGGELLDEIHALSSVTHASLVLRSELTEV